MPDAAPRRIPLMPLAGLVAVLLAAIAALLLSHSVSQANRWVNHTVRVQVAIAGLGEEFAKHDAAYRGYLLSGQSVFLPEVARTRAEMGARFAELRALTADNPRQQAQLDAIAPLLASRLRYADRQMRERASGAAPAGRTVAGADRLPLGVRLAYAVQAHLDQMYAEEQRLIGRRQAETEALARMLLAGLVATVMVVVFVAFLTVSDARARYVAMERAHEEAREAARAARAEMRAREEAEEQLRQSQKMESLGQLTGGIAHDFNNMLAIIIGSLDMARRRHDDPERVVRYVGNALDGAERVAGLVARLLAFSRRQPLAPVALDPNRLVTGMTELLRRTLGEQVAIRTDLTAEPWGLYVDPMQLENAILNLAVNARDAIPGSGTLTIETVNCSVGADDGRGPAHVPPGDYVKIAVHDDGAGMNEEVRARAFDPFFTTKPVGHGTGLGLSQVFGFVTQSGGHVAIDSRLGEGSTVSLYLPRHGEAPLSPAVAPAVVPAAARSSGGERVLVVEDDDRVRRFSIEALRELGYIPLSAANADEALALIARDIELSLLFTDVVMPGMTGPELAEQVRATRPGLKILFTTGYARAAAGHALTPEPLLPKPFTVAELASKLREVIEAP